jgi:DNA-binding CsgD family transcriptional regulator
LEPSRQRSVEDLRGPFVPAGRHFSSRPAGGFSFGSVRMGTAGPSPACHGRTTERGTALSIYRSKLKPKQRVVGQNEVRRPAARHENAIELLTPREAEISRFVAAGLSNTQIARKASISEGTVKTHLHRVYQKLGVANRSALVVMVNSGTRSRGQDVRLGHKPGS